MRPTLADFVALSQTDGKAFRFLQQLTKGQNSELVDDRFSVRKAYGGHLQEKKVAGPAGPQSLPDSEPMEKAAWNQTLPKKLTPYLKKQAEGFQDELTILD